MLGTGLGASKPHAVTPPQCLPTDHPPADSPQPSVQGRRSVQCPSSSLRAQTLACLLSTWPGCTFAGGLSRLWGWSCLQESPQLRDLVYSSVVTAPGRGKLALQGTLYLASSNHL